MFKKLVIKHGENGELRMYGKIAELACGYGGSVGALKAFGASEMGIEELQPIVDAWRTANSQIVKLWHDVESVAKEVIRQRTSLRSHGLTFACRGGMLYITLPSGRNLSYVRPRIGSNRFGGESIEYMGTDITKHWGRVETFGGKLVENCLAKGTLVLTDKGLIPIEQVSFDIRVWDGMEFVEHEGLMNQGLQEVINVSGIYMTPDHKILTERGWVKSGQSEGLNWAKVSLPYSIVQSRKQPTRKASVALSMHMRKKSYCIDLGFARQKIPSQILRLYEKSINKRSKKDSWNVQSSSLGCLA